MGYPDFLETLPKRHFFITKGKKRAQTFVIPKIRNDFCYFVTAGNMYSDNIFATCGCA